MNKFLKTGMSLMMGAAISLIATSAFASSGDLSQEAFETILILIGVIGLAFVIARGVSDWIEKKWGIVSGAEYIVLGAIVGPGLSILSREIVIQISPAIILAEGSLGLYAGLIAWDCKKHPGSFSIGSLTSLFTFLAVAGIPALGLFYFRGPEFVIQNVPHLLVFGAIAMIADGRPIRSLVSFLRAKGDGVLLIQSSATVSTSMAIIVFGLIFCLFKPAETLVPGLELSAIESILFWLAIHILLGSVLAVIFALFLLEDFSEEKLLAVGVGIVIFTSGVAYFLRLSPIFVSFMLGITFTRISKQRDNVQKMLMSIERPAYISLYFFLGATLSFEFYWAALLGPFVYIVLRHFGRWTGSIVSRQVPEAEPYPLMGRALWGPGALSAAMALNYFSVFRDTAYANEVYLVIVVSILLSEPLAYRFARIWLIDATDVNLENSDNPLISREVAR